MMPHYEADVIVQGIEITWTAWGKMRGENLTQGDISYLKSENGKGIERIFSVDIKENQESRIEQMLSLMRSGILPDSILITPNTKPSNLAEILSHKGFVINDTDPYMLLYLKNYEEKRQERANFTISNVTDKERLSDWLHIVTEALFRRELVTLEQFSDILNSDTTSFYLGIIDDIPATACMTINNGDTSALEMVATLKEYRRKGLASMLINKALIDLRHKGIKTVSLHADADGVGVYKQLGFRECFKRIVAQL